MSSTTSKIFAEMSLTVDSLLHPRDDLATQISVERGLVSEEIDPAGLVSAAGVVNLKLICRIFWDISFPSDGSRFAAPTSRERCAERERRA
jgi:hypothetical protein